MELSYQERLNLIETLSADLNGKIDGGRKNILLSRCPFCGHSGYKFGIRITPSVNKREFGSSHCFSCGRSCRTLKQTLELLDRQDLIPKETMDFEEILSPELELFEEELDDECLEISMPKGYKRTYKNPYLKSRGWVPFDFEYFEVGTNRGMDWKLEDYVIVPIIENKKYVGYVARHTWSKSEIEEYNDKHRRKILRYRNSSGEDSNGFEKLLYNIDTIVPGITDTVILCEGVFDVVGLTRKLELYDNSRIVPVASFGKKVSEIQLFKLQDRGIKTLVVGYDQDAIDTTSSIIKDLEQYFDVYVIDIPQSWEEKDFDEMKASQVYDLFSKHILTVREFNLKGVL